MAAVTILIKDEPDELVSFSLESDPPIDVSDDGEVTKAQNMALYLIDFVIEGAKGIKEMSVNGDPVRVQNPKLN